MKIKYILFLNVGLISLGSSTIVTPSEAKVPISLIPFLNCPYGNIHCKNTNKNSCTSLFNLCQNTNSEISKEFLSINGLDIGDLKPEEFCKILLEVCDMIMDYDPPLTDNYVYDYSIYFDCNTEDLECINGQITSCKSVAVKCYENYPKKDCDYLLTVCNSIETGIVPRIMTTSSNSLNIPSYEDLSYSLLINLECPVDDIPYENSEKSSYNIQSNICRYFNSSRLRKKVFFNHKYDNASTPPNQKQQESKRSPLKQKKKQQQFKPSPPKQKKKQQKKGKRKQKSKEEPPSIEKLLQKKQLEKSKLFRNIQQKNQKQLKNLQQKNIIPIEKLIPEKLLEKLPLKNLPLEKLQLRKRWRQLRILKRILRRF